MATLEKIRKRAGLLVAVVGVALFAFIIGDFLNSGTTYFGASREKVGKVDGKTLKISEFQKEITTLTDVYKENGEMRQDGDIRDEVWNTFVKDALVNNEAEKIGMGVSPAELKEATLGPNLHWLMYRIPIFFRQGSFDKNLLLNILNNLDDSNAVPEQIRNYWLHWERKIKEQILADKYLILVAKTITATKAEAALIAELNKKEMDAAYVRKSYYEIPDSTITVSDKELQEKYNSIKQRFKTDGYRSMKVVIFEIVPSPTDFSNTEVLAQDAKKHLQEFSGEDLDLYVTQTTDPAIPHKSHFRTENDVDPFLKDFAFSAPQGEVFDVKLDNGYYKTAKVLSNVALRSDSVKASRIIIQRQTEAETQRVADSLLAALKQGADFVALAEQYAINKNSVQVGRDLELWYREGDAQLEEFDNTVFTAKEGDYVIVKSQKQNNMAIVVRIDEKTAPVKKVKFAEVAIRVEASNFTFSEIYDKANQLMMANRTLDALVAAAGKQGLIVRDLNRLSKNEHKVPYAFEQARPVIKWAWENKEGAVCDKVFEVPDAFVVAAVSEVVEDDYIPLKYVTEQVKSELLKDKKGELIANELKGISNLESLSLPVDTLFGIKFSQTSFNNLGREPLIPAVAYSTNVNEISVPVKGNGGVYLLKVLDKREVPVDLSFETNTLNSNIRASMRGLFESLKKSAKIEDNRSNFF